MAFSFVQTSTQGSTTTATTTVTFSAGTGSGNLVVGFAKLSDASHTLTSITDDKGNTYATVGPITSSNNAVRVYMVYGVQTTPGATVLTFTSTGNTGTFRCGADEFSGGASSNAAVFDVSATATAQNVGGTPDPSLTLSPSASGKLIWSGVAANSAFVATAGSGFTRSNGGASSLGGHSQYKLSGTTSETAPMTGTVSGSYWCEVAGSFNPASGVTVNAGFFRFM